MTTEIEDGTVQGGDAWRLLSHPLRRELLVELTNYDDPVGLETVTAGLCRSGRPAAGDALDERAGERVAIELHHTHLPLLATAGWIGYDAADRAIRYREGTVEELESALRSLLVDLYYVLDAIEEATTVA